MYGPELFSEAFSGAQNYFPKRFPAQHQDCQPCELVPAYVHLASGDSSYVTGQVIHVNGGTITGS